MRRTRLETFEPRVLPSLVAATVLVSATEPFAMRYSTMLLDLADVLSLRNDTQMVPSLFLLSERQSPRR